MWSRTVMPPRASVSFMTSITCSRVMDALSYTAQLSFL